VSAQDQKGWTTLDHDLRSGNATLSRQILERTGNDLGKATAQGWTPLHFAAAWLPELVTDVWAVRKDQVDAATADGSTALMLALRQGDGWEALLKAGARTELKSNTGWTAMAVALRFGREAAVRVLLNRAFDHRAAADGWNLIHLAARYQPGILPALTAGWSRDETAALLSARTNSGQTPLHLAVVSRSAEAIRWLLQQGADASLKDDKGRTPAEQARAQGDEAWFRGLAP
jgi:ankyrin repeat protein